jgi:hypothetical protein
MLIYVLNMYAIMDNIFKYMDVIMHIGVYFNDSTKIVLSPDGVVFQYIERKKKENGSSSSEHTIQVTIYVFIYKCLYRHIYTCINMYI